jgi:hypothetical protein
MRKALHLYVEPKESADNNVLQDSGFFYAVGLCGCFQPGGLYMSQQDLFAGHKLLRHLARAVGRPATFALLALMVTTIGTAAPLLAQGTGASTTAAVDEETVSIPERATYLERHHAARAIMVYKDRTLNDIKRLKVLVANFGSNVDGASTEFQRIRDLYQQAEKERYRRRFVESEKLHREARKLVLELYKKFTARFQDQVADLLAQCAQNMVDAEFAVSGEPGQTGGTTSKIFLSSQKLYIAYQQTAMAENMMRSDRFDEAITHYRLAKSFAINVLTNLEDNPQKQDEIEKKYRVDLLDARGFSSGATGTE